MAEYMDFANDSSDVEQYEYAEPSSDTSYDVQVDEAIDRTLDEVYASPKTKQQDQAISFMLEVSTRDELLRLTKTFTAAEDAGYNHCLSIISEIPTEDRASRFKAVESLSTHSMSDLLASVEHKPRTGVETYFQTRNREHSSPSSKELRLVPPKRYGCPGQQGTCLEHRNRAWRSFVTFFEHVQTNHLGEFETPYGLMCLECVKRDNPTSPIAYPSHGRELAKHIWTDHMTSIPGRSGSRSSQ